MDTIFALATARGKAGVAVVRISGARARSGLAAMVGQFPPPRQAGVRKIWLGDDVLDQALVIWFESGASFTGEEVVELHLHGSPAIIGAVLRHLAGIDGFRMAEAGEFTRRALMNGCLDLTQVEGLSDLIAAETEAQRRQAMRVFSGRIGEKCASWKQVITRAMALLTAVIDFSDEEIPDSLRSEVGAMIGAVLDDLYRERDGFGAAERIRDGFEVAIIGKPNVGKSTLLNRIAGRSAALTSDRAGTTRDVIEIRLDISGIPVTLLDTAGIRASDDPLEAMGIDLALERAKAADLRIFLAETPGEVPPFTLDPHDIVLVAKDDVGATGGQGISGLTGAGVEALMARLTGRFSGELANAGTITRERHRTAIVSAIGALEVFCGKIARPGVGEELLMEELRVAASAMDVLLGRFDIEDLLGEIFSSFCIGK